MTGNQCNTSKKKKRMRNTHEEVGRFSRTFRINRSDVLLQGFVSENPTAPIQLSRRRAPPCLNEFCRLGCVCLGLSRDSRISHCGRPACMFGCSCLKQKVVLLKNLDGSDSSPSSHHGSTKKKRRMKMAYSESLRFTV